MEMKLATFYVLVYHQIDRLKKLELNLKLIVKLHLMLKHLSLTEISLGGKKRKLNPSLLLLSL